MRTKSLHPKVYQRLLAQIPVPERFSASTFANFDVADQRQAGVLEAAQVFADNFPDQMDSGRSLIMYGTPGTGKTHLAFAIAKEIARRGFASRYVTAPQLERKIGRGRFDPCASINWNALDDYTAADLLIIDNVDLPLDTAELGQVLQMVIMERYSQCRPTIVITSLGRSAFTHLLGTHAMDRLAANGTRLMKMEWASYRCPKATTPDTDSADRQGVQI